MSAEAVCPPHEPAAERGAIIRLVGNESPCCGWSEGGCEAGKIEKGNHDVKYKGEGVKVLAGSRSASSHYETSKLEIRSY